MDKTADNPTIVFCINELDVGGAEKALVRIASGLHQRNRDVRVISLRDAGPLTDPLQQQGIPVMVLGGGGFADIRIWWRLRTAFRQLQPQIVVSFLHQANIAARIAACGTGIPVVSGIRVADRRRWVIASDRLTACCTVQYVAVSSHVADTHAQLCRLPADRITAIPNGVDVPAESTGRTNSSSATSSDNGPELLFVGRLTPQKAPLDLLTAFASLPEAVRDSTRLTFVGDGELRAELDAAVQKMGLTRQVELVGQADDVPQRMRSATALVLPSHWEGMPNVVLEAMACGLPIVATAVDGTLDLLEADKTGWLVKPGDPAALSRAMADCLQHDSLRRKYALAAQNVARTRFSWESVVDRYEQLLTSLLSPAASPSDGEM